MIHENQTRTESVLHVAQMMMSAARTAPKGRGRDTLFVATASGEELMAVAHQMDLIATKENLPFFARDAANLRQSIAMVLLGTAVSSLGLSYCGYCGLNTCAQKNEYSQVPCAFNLVDLGIAVGSAVSVASGFGVDNRVMYSAGRAALELGMCGEGVSTVFAIPLSVSAKSPYFDR